MCVGVMSYVAGLGDEGVLSYCVAMLIFFFRTLLEDDYKQVLQSRISASLPSSTAG